MRRYLLLAVMAGVLLPFAALAQEGKNNGEGDEKPGDDAMEAIDLRARQLDVEARESDLKFQNEMRTIELEKKKLEFEREREKAVGRGRWDGPSRGAHRGLHCIFLAGCAIVHILLAIWVYGDIRKRNAGSGIWIVVTLMTGFLGALLYAVVRLGDKPAEK